MKTMKLVVAAVALVALITVARYTGCMSQQNHVQQQGYERVCYAWTVWQPYDEAIANHNKNSNNPFEERMHNGERLMRMCVQSEGKMVLRPLQLK